MFDPITAGALLLLKGKVGALMAGHAAGGAATAAHGAAMHGAAASSYMGPDPSSGYYAGGYYYGPDPSQACYNGYGPNQAYYNGSGSNQFSYNGPDGSSIAKKAASRAWNAREDRKTREDIDDMLCLLVHERVFSRRRAESIWADAESSRGRDLIRVWEHVYESVRRNGLC